MCVRCNSIEIQHQNEPFSLRNDVKEIPMITEQSCVCGCVGCSEGDCCDHLLTFGQYQQGAAVTARGPVALAPHKGRAAIACMGLAGEAGELIDHIKKWVGHGHDLDKDYLSKELGDILWYVAEIATIAELDLDDVAKGNERKLRNRYPEGFSIERSVNRGE